MPFPILILKLTQILIWLLFCLFIGEEISINNQKIDLASINVKSVNMDLKCIFIYKNIGADVQLRCALPLVNKDAANLNNVSK